MKIADRQFNLIKPVERGEETDRSHSRGNGCLYSGRRVLKYDAFCRNGPEPLRGFQINIRKRLGTSDIVSAEGWRPLIELAALLSLNLAIFNALPLPMLDGGRMFFVFVEILRGGRRIAPEKEAMVHLVGFAFLMAGVLVITYFDIARLVT